jgi:folate-binding Fe-S cluster repair protein YgfZ
MMGASREFGSLVTLTDRALWKVAGADATSILDKLITTDMVTFVEGG